jgi:hypothetical protein
LSSWPVRAQAGDGTAGTLAVERVAAVGAHHLDAAAREGKGHDAIAQVMGPGRHGDHLCGSGFPCWYNRQTGTPIMVETVPRILAEWMGPFIGCFTASNWNHVLVLVAGAVLSPGRRTVTAALRVMGLDHRARALPSITAS